MIQIYSENNNLYNLLDKQRRNEDTKRTGTPARDSFERDYGRIVHSAAFRRLQAKTQVFGIEEGDFHRTRLTHSMEVSQIARGIVLSLNKKDKILRDNNCKIDSSLIEAAALAHDFGHPPFGHRGEHALNQKMYNHGGFEGNAQTFRILTKLERGQGLNLTRATLMAILKYPIFYSNAVNPELYKNGNYNPPKTSIYEQDIDYFDWIVQELNPEEKLFYQKYDEALNKHNKPLNKTLECSIIELADDIAYATHDLEDALRLRLIDIKEVIEILEPLGKYKSLNTVIEKLNKNSEIHFSQKIKDATADLISLFISNVNIKFLKEFNSPRLKYYAYLPDDLRNLKEKLINFIREKVIYSQRVQTLEYKGENIVKKLFDAFYDEQKLLNEEDRKLISKGGDKYRIVCDYIAGMTDSYALTMYSRIFEATESRLFDI